MEPKKLKNRTIQLWEVYFPEDDILFVYDEYDTAIEYMRDEGIPGEPVLAEYKRTKSIE